jgi:hypothetical protein
MDKALKWLPALQRAAKALGAIEADALAAPTARRTSR